MHFPPNGWRLNQTMGQRCRVGCVGNFGVRAFGQHGRCSIEARIPVHCAFHDERMVFHPNGVANVCELRRSGQRYQ
jgi:hypothetical protein